MSIEDPYPMCRYLIGIDPEGFCGSMKFEVENGELTFHFTVDAANFDEEEIQYLPEWWS